MSFDSHGNCSPMYGIIYPVHECNRKKCVDSEGPVCLVCHSYKNELLYSAIVVINSIRTYWMNALQPDRQIRHVRIIGKSDPQRKREERKTYCVCAGVIASVPLGSCFIRNIMHSRTYAHPKSVRGLRVSLLRKLQSILRISY